MTAPIEELKLPVQDSFTKKFNYAVGMFGTSIPINMLTAYAFTFYVLKLGVTTKQFALLAFIYTFIDFTDNPVYGFLSDRTRTRWGRRRPWLVIGTPLLVLFFVLFFSPPSFLEGNSLFVYCLLFYCLAGTLDSVINANYGALFPELFRTDGSRAATNALRQAFQLVAMILSIALTPMITSKIGYQATAIVYGILGGAVILYMSLTSREVKFQEEEEKPRLWDSLKTLLVNKKVWIAGLANAFYSAAMNLVKASVPFFIIYKLKLADSYTTYLIGSVLIIGIICVGIWASLVRRYSLIPVWRAALLTMTLAYVPLYFANTLITSILAGSLVGFGFAGVITTMDLVGAKIMDEDTKKHNLRREGFISSTMGVLNRISGWFVSIAYYLVFKLYQFESGEVPGPHPDQAAQFLLTIFPFILMLISFAFSWFINFDKEGKTAPVSTTVAQE